MEHASPIGANWSHWKGQEGPKDQGESGQEATPGRRDVAGGKNLYELRLQAPGMELCHSISIHLQSTNSKIQSVRISRQLLQSLKPQARNSSEHDPLQLQLVTHHEASSH